MLFAYFLVVQVFLAVNSVNCRKIHIQIRDNVTQSCPNVDSDIIDESTLKISMKMLKNDRNMEEDDEKDEVSITDLNGENRKIDFPGCYRVKISFRMLRPIENPYIEAFMQLGQNVPCKSEQENLRGVDSICANVTSPTKWCPESYNSQLRDMLGGKKTCKFCSLCENAKEAAKENESKLSKIRKFLSNEGREECSTAKDDGVHRYTFKMCTPTREELDEQEDTKDKVEEYWHYLKQVKMDGIMTTVIHVMDRNPMKFGRSEQCQKMCDTFGKMANQNYRETLSNSIEKLCAPVDTYAACLMHTVKFDVNSDF